MEIKATGLPETIEDYQVALNAAFAGGKAYGLAQRTWVGLTDEEAHELWESTDSDDDWELMKRTEAKLKEKNT
jgi:hypothetical protein